MVDDCYWGSWKPLNCRARLLLRWGNGPWIGNRTWECPFSPGWCWRVSICKASPSCHDGWFGWWFKHFLFSLWLIGWLTNIFYRGLKPPSSDDVYQFRTPVCICIIGYRLWRRRWCILTGLACCGAPVTQTQLYHLCLILLHAHMHNMLVTYSTGRQVHLRTYHTFAQTSSLLAKHNHGFALAVLHPCLWF